jgi:hypothetical protein
MAPFPRLPSFGMRAALPVIRHAHDLIPLLAAALDARADLIARLHDEQTDAYRLFHGSVEGHPGLTIDRYGELLLVQCFHSPLATQASPRCVPSTPNALPGLTLVYNDRSQANSRIANPLPPDQLEAAMLPREMHEMGVVYRIAGRHAGQDPWLFLDLRAARRRVMQEAPGKSLLNLFAYTGGVGIAAAKAGARFVVNVDFADSSLSIGKENARLNELPVRPRFVKCDAFAAMRQYAGIGQPERVRGKRMPPFPQAGSADLRPGLPRSAALTPRAPSAWWTWSMTTPRCSSRPCSAYRGRHADLHQQRGRREARRLAGPVAAQRGQGRPADPRDGMDPAGSRLPEFRRPAAVEDRPAAGLTERTHDAPEAGAPATYSTSPRRISTRRWWRAHSRRRCWSTSAPTGVRPCLVLGPLLDRLARSYGGAFLLANVDADENMRIAGRHKVRGFPTVIAYSRGVEIDRFHSAQTEGFLRKFIDRVIERHAAGE